MTEFNRSSLIEALKSADWSGASVGNKALIKAAIAELVAAQGVADDYHSLLPKLSTLLDSENPEFIYSTWCDGLTEGEKLAWGKVAESSDSLRQAYEEARILHAFSVVGVDKIIQGLPLANEGFA